HRGCGAVWLSVFRSNFFNLSKNFKRNCRRRGCARSPAAASLSVVCGGRWPLSMRAVLAAWLLLAGWLEAARLDVPLEATVKSSSVYVRSRPGEDYYPTEMLRAGDRVKIVRE